MPTLFPYWKTLRFFVLKQDTGLCRLHKAVYVSDAPCQCWTVRSLRRMPCSHPPWPWRLSQKNPTLEDPVCLCVPLQLFFTRKELQYLEQQQWLEQVDTQKKAQTTMGWIRLGSCEAGDTCLDFGLIWYIHQIQQIQQPQAGRASETIKCQCRALCWRRPVNASCAKCNNIFLCHPLVYLGSQILAFIDPLVRRSLQLGH